MVCVCYSKYVCKFCLLAKLSPEKKRCRFTPWTCFICSLRYNNSLLTWRYRSTGDCHVAHYVPCSASALLLRLLTHVRRWRLCRLLHLRMLTVSSNKNETIEWYVYVTCTCVLNMLHVFLFEDKDWSFFSL